MNQEPLLSSYQELKQTKKSTSVAWQYLAALALGATIAYVGSPSSALNIEGGVNFWLNQAKAEYNWNVTSIMQWSAVATFIQVAVSPLGDLYGIQTYNNGQSTVNYAYKFDFRTGQWNIFDNSISNYADIKFDKVGNMFYLTSTGTVLDASNKQIPLISSGVRDFEVTVKKNVYACNNAGSYSSNAFNTNIWDSLNNGFTVKNWGSQTYTKFVLVNDVPLFVDANSKTVGYGNVCVTDIAAGVDGTVWALDCVSDGNGNFNIMKWDPYLTQWYFVPGRTGVKIAAYNEISAAVLTASGLIYLSSDTGDNYLPVYQQRGNVQLSLYSNSSLITSTAGKIWLQAQLPNYGQSALIWAARTQGWSSSNINAAIKNIQATGCGILFVIKSQTGMIFGGFESQVQSFGGYFTDNNAFIYSLDNQIRLNPSIYPQYAFYSTTGYTAAFGGGHDLYLADGAGSNTNSYTNLGHSYTLPSGYSYSTVGAQTLLHGSASQAFQPVDLEVWAMWPTNNGQQL